MHKVFPWVLCGRLQITDKFFVLFMLGWIYKFQLCEVILIKDICADAGVAFFEKFVLSESGI
jgi:hypothetical protein